MAHFLCGEVVIFGLLDAIVLLDCEILYIYIYIYIYILLKILLIIEHNGMSHQNIYQTTRRYMAEDRTRSSSCLIATNLHRDIIIMSVWSHHRQFRETAYRYSRLP